MSGTLYLCATPIGNLGDVSARLLEAFKNADLIACEDTRRTLQLLNHFDIHKPLTSYHEHNKHEKGEYITSLLLEGKNIVLVSDAGSPAISDPGEDLVRLCIEKDIAVTSVPGPVAFVTALILSGLPTARFSFEGFLSVNKRHRREHLDMLKYDTRTLIFYEAPHKLKNTLADMCDVFGGGRRIALARELTKIHEDIFRTTISEAVDYYNSNAPRGEYVLVIEGCTEDTSSDSHWWDTLTIAEHIDKYIADGYDKKEAIKLCATDRDLPKREVYGIYHKA